METVYFLCSRVRDRFPKTVALYWHFPVYLQNYAGEEDQSRDAKFRTRPGTVLRKGKWKLHEYFEDGALLALRSRKRPWRDPQPRCGKTKEATGFEGGYVCLA